MTVRFRLWTADELEPRGVLVARRLAKHGKDELHYQGARGIIDGYEDAARDINVRATALNRRIAEAETSAAGGHLRELREGAVLRLAEEETRHAQVTRAVRTEIEALDRQIESVRAEAVARIVSVGSDELSETLSEHSRRMRDELGQLGIPTRDAGDTPAEVGSKAAESATLVLRRKRWLA